MDVEPNSDNSSSPNMETPPPIHLLPIELLVKIIEKLPRVQWPALELIDRKFRDAVLLAWGSIRQVDIERDFIYSTSKAIEYESDLRPEMIEERATRQIVQNTEVVLKKLSERSPNITSLCGLAFITDDPAMNTTAVRYLSEFEHLKAIKFGKKIYLWKFVLGWWKIEIICDVPLINFIEFMESTQSRATLKEIDIEQCRIPDDPIMTANFDQRLRTAFANDPNNPTRQLLQLESFTMRLIGRKYPLSFIDSIDGSSMTKLSLGNSYVEPAALTTLVNGAPQLQHLDFAFLLPCDAYDNTPMCQGGRLQPNKNLLAALASHRNLSSLGFSSIWDYCACHRFVAEFKEMLRTIGPQLVNLVFKPNFFPSGIRLRNIRDIIQHRMPQLKSITLDKCAARDPEEFRGIADGKELEEIEITAFRNNYEAILNEVLSTIIDKSPRLKRFIGIDYFPDQRVVAALCKLTDLTHLRFRADRLTQENFIAFSQQVFAEKLEILHLGPIREGAESGLIDLISKAAQLRELSVDQHVNDRLLECLAESCPNFEKCSARLTDGITFEGVQMLVDRCPKLRWLAVDDWSGTFASSLKDLVLDQYRKLEFGFFLIGKFKFFRQHDERSKGTFAIDNATIKQESR